MLISRNRSNQGLRIRTGMGGLDEKLGGGIPSGSSVLLISNQEGPVRLFCQQIAFLLANEGHRILYFTIVREPSYIREEMMVYEWDTREMEQGRQWTFIDAYSPRVQALQQGGPTQQPTGLLGPGLMKGADRKSTRLNSSHLVISYAVFCLKKKNSLRRWSLAQSLTRGSSLIPLLCWPPASSPSPSRSGVGSAMPSFVVTRSLAPSRCPLL